VVFQLSLKSDPGTENYGVANAHTLIRHRLDPNLLNTLQHRFARGHNNILSEIKWSVFRRDFAPGFEDILQDGVNCGWYNVNDPLEKLLFRWIAIPWLQAEIDKWVSFKNKSAPRAMRNKLMPRGIPQLIRSNPSHFNSLDFKIVVPSNLLDEMEELYAPPCHPVFDLVPPAFHDHVSNAYSEIGKPNVDVDTFWEVYLSLRRRLRERSPEQITEIVTSYQGNVEELEADPDNIPLLPNMEDFRLGQPLDLGNKTCYIGGIESAVFPGSIEGLIGEYADFTDESDEDGSAHD